MVLSWRAPKLLYLPRNRLKLFWSLSMRVIKELTSASCMQKKLFIGQDLTISLRNWFSIVNSVYSTHILNASKSLTCLWGRRFHYTLGPSWWQISFILRVHLICWLWITQASFLVVCKLSSMTGQHVANQWKLIFSEYGWPETFISDNGPCYTVEVFTSVMNAYHVNHITSSPHYPQSNVLAEKYVQIIKSLFYKAKGEG